MTIWGLLCRELGKGSADQVTQQLDVMSWVGDLSASVFSPAAVRCKDHPWGEPRFLMRAEQCFFFSSCFFFLQHSEGALLCVSIDGSWSLRFWREQVSRNIQVGGEFKKPRPLPAPVGGPFTPHSTAESRSRGVDWWRWICRNMTVT